MSFAIALLMAAAAPEDALAADAAATADDDQTIVVTGLRENADTALTFSEPVRDVPLTVNTVEAEFIDAVSAQRLRDLFAYIPGVDATETNGATGDSIVIRGFQTARRLSINGLRRPLNYDNQTTDLETIERVEIVKGPAGLEFGVTDPGGSINFVTRKPLDRFGARVEASYGSFDTANLTADVSAPLASDVGARAIVHLARADSFRDTLDSERVTVATNLRWTYAPGSNVVVELGYSYQDLSYDRGTFYLEGAPADAAFDRGFAPVERSFHEPTDRLPSHLLRGAVYVQQQLVEGLNANLAFDGVLDDFRSFGARNPNLNGLYAAGTNRWNGTNRTVQRSMVTFDSGRQAYVVQADLDGAVKLGRVELAARGGVTRSDYDEIQRGQDGQTRWNIDAFAPIYGTAPVVLGTVDTVGRNFLNTTAIEETGWFVSGKVELAERFRLFAGYRRDRFESVNDYVDNVTRNTPLQRTVVENRATAWRAGASLDLVRWLTVFAGASRSEIPQTGQLRLSGEVVAPLEATSYEAGVKFGTQTGAVTGSATVFQITQDNQTVADPLNLPGQSFVENVGKVRVRGAEIEAMSRIGALTLRLGGSYLDSRIRTLDARTRGPGAQFGNRFFNVPEWDGFARATYDLSSLGVDGLSAGVGVVHSGKRFGNNANNFVLPAYTRLDAALYYQTGRFGFRLTAENLTDERYYLGSQNRPQNIAPGVPLNVTGAVTVRW